MNYKEYLAACQNFAKASQSWERLDQSRFFTTRSVEPGGWCETCDNAHGGIDVSWAFHLDEDRVNEDAPSMYARNIVSVVQSMIDNEVDYDTMSDVMREFDD